MPSEDRSSEPILCEQHGPQPATFVCRHLAESVVSGERVGYNPSVQNPDNPRPGAWCDDCERVRIDHGGDWNETSKAFAQITLLCAICYDQARDLNK